MSDDISDISAGRIANWERYGVDAIRADLQTGGDMLVGGSQDVRQQAWRWVRWKEQQINAAQAKPPEVMTLRPGLWGMNIDLKALWKWIWG